MVFGQTERGQNVGKARVTWRRFQVIGACVPFEGRICVSRVEPVLNGGFDRLEVGGQRAILQAFGHVKPPEPIFMKDERCVTRNGFEAFGITVRLCSRVVYLS